MENTNLVTKPNPRQLFERPEVQERFKNILGKKSAGFIVSVINCINSNDMLQHAEQNSILFAAANAATLDLPVNQNLGFAYIVPYRDHKTGVVSAQFQMGYKGFIQLAQRSGQFKTINAMDVRDGEIVAHDRLTGEITFQWIENQQDREKAPVIGYVGYFKMLNGFEKTLFMGIDELKRHGKKYSQSFKKGYGLWEDNFDAMAIKTVLKLLLSKYAPLSIEMQRAVISDQAILSDWEGQSIQYTDNEVPVVSLEEQSRMKEEERVRSFIEAATESVQLLECEEYISSLPIDHPLHALFSNKAQELADKPVKSL
jgi:recombination protein RecT